MKRLVVVENLKRWPLRLQGAETVSAREYLVDPAYVSLRGAAVFNLCTEYRYQSLGYYVSLLAAARGHRPFPDVATLQDLGAGPSVKVVAESLNELVQRSLATIQSDEFELSIYFGRNLAKRHEALARAVFNAIPAPFLRARFTKQTRWRLAHVRPIAAADIPEAHRDFVIEQCERYFAGAKRGTRRRVHQHDMAILCLPDDPEPPSDAGAIRKIIKAARQEGFDARVISPDDYGRVAEFDALFIRETTAVNHHTYRFARRAQAQGLVVVDDPDSILRCTNKVFQAEVFARHHISTPPTLIVHGRNVEEIESAVGFPCVLKRPDSSFSLGVTKVASPRELEAELEAAFRLSPLVIAQAWTPSTFDWRIGTLAGEALFACRYHMVRGHWQIAAGGNGAARRYGRVEAVPMDEVPHDVRDVAVRAARLMGGGLYGVDVKEVDGGALVMEVNDNPNIDAGNEDGVIGDGLYAAIAGHFRRAVERRGDSGATS